jgi:Uma2 family endonuclease
MKGSLHRVAVQRTMRAIERLLPPGWHAAKEEPVRIPNRRSEPEPDVSVVLGSIDDYTDYHPGPADVALVVEVTRTTAAKDRKLARVYGAGGIPTYWIVNVPKRRLEVYAGPIGGRYPPPTILGETESVELVIAGQVAGRIAVADLLPRRP